MSVSEGHCIVSDSELKATYSLLFTDRSIRQYNNWNHHTSSDSNYYASTMDLNPQTIGRLTQSSEHLTNADTYGAYKRVDQKIKPISQKIPQEFKVTYTVLYDPLTTLVPIDVNFTDPESTQKFTQEQIDKIDNDMRSHEFLSSEECNLFLLE
jgi:hypothetical protein